jgi:hypothetical protein
MNVRFALCLAALTGMLCAGAAHAQDDGQPASRFGAVEAFWFPEAACDSGIGWERIIFDWAEHQPAGPDDWNIWNVQDAWLEDARSCGREVVAVVKHTPAWATDGTPGIGVPRGLDLPVDDPGNLWAGFMRRAAEYYAPRGVSRFIVWNEPDIPAGTYGYEFEGDVNDYARLLAVAHQAARLGNPDAEIIIAGTTYWHDVNAGRRLYLDRLLETLTALPDAAQHGHFFDALALHIYFRTDTVYDITRQATDLLAAHGLSDKRIWIAETNASPNLDPQWPVTRPQYQITLAQQADFLVQAAFLGLAAGADRIAAYKFYDWSLEPGAESFALIRADRSYRPAYYAWRALAGWLDDEQSAALARADVADVVALRLAGGRLAVAGWARTGESILLRIGPTDGIPDASVMDVYGNMMPAAPDAEGALSVLLGGAVCNRRDGCAVGGSPVIVMMNSSDLPEAALLTIDGEIPLQFSEEMHFDGGE